MTSPAEERLGREDYGHPLALNSSDTASIGVLGVDETELVGLQVDLGDTPQKGISPEGISARLWLGADVTRFGLLVDDVLSGVLVDVVDAVRALTADDANQDNACVGRPQALGLGWLAAVPFDQHNLDVVEAAVHQDRVFFGTDGECDCASMQLQSHGFSLVLS